MPSPNADPQAIKKVVYAIHGENAVIVDPSNPEASKKAVDEGRLATHALPVHARGVEGHPGTRHSKARRPKPIPTEGEADPVGMPAIPEPEWTDDMWEMARYTKAVSTYLTRAECGVEFQGLPYRPDQRRH